MPTRFRVRFTGLCGLVVPKKDNKRLDILLTDVRTPFQPLRLKQEELLDLHLGFIEFRGPARVNGVDLLGPAYVPLAGQTVVLKTDREGPLKFPRKGTGIKGLINMDKVVKNCSCDDSPLLVARVRIPANTMGRIRPGRRTVGHWSIPKTLADGSGDYFGNWANSFDFRPRIDEHDSLTIRVKGADKTDRYRVSSLGGQDVAVFISNVCNPIPSLCNPAEDSSDPDFRAHYELLAPRVRHWIRRKLGSKGLLPVPSARRFTQQRPCFPLTLPGG